MAPVILKSFIEVGNRLADLGTSRELLIEIADAVVAARTESTENDPAGTRGYRGWQMGTRRSRELHIGRDDDWTKDDTDQIASILNKARGLKIVVCNSATMNDTAKNLNIVSPSSAKGHVIPVGLPEQSASVGFQTDAVPLRPPTPLAPGRRTALS